MTTQFSLPLSVYRERREAVQSQLQNNEVALLIGAQEQLRNRDVEQAFRQSSDMLYLTGFAEPDAALVLTSEQAILAVRPKDPDMEVWTGFRYGPEGAVDAFGVDRAVLIDDLDELLIELAPKAWRYAYDDPRGHARVGALQAKLVAKTRRSGEPPASTADLNSLVHNARLVKSPAEQDLMRQAGQLSARAHKRAMKMAKPGVMEYQLQAEIEHEHRMAGSKREAYGAIVAGGNNANVLHYISNDQPIADGDLVLIDAGCEYENYAADITRTWPINGRFSEAQAMAYNWVLKAQLAAIDAVHPGQPFERYHEVALAVLVEGLIDMGVLSGTVQENIESAAYRPYYMHRTGHWLGMDVHDVGTYHEQGESRLLQPGMVVTVEPGLYFDAAGDAPEHLKGIGIRIEDDVLVTDGEPEVLTADVPKQIQDIEAWMAG
ncbi:MAG: aminopeptidase P N-terminal domain-containing protein [Pseudomonadales bacterium]|jgi:Xaa-Pro aminopeptidase